MVELRTKTDVDAGLHAESGLPVFDPIAALSVAVDRLERAWLPAELQTSQEFFGYQPTPIPVFMDDMRVALSAAKGKRFLEVGCGMGTKMILAQALGLTVTGIDIREQYAAAARYLWSEATVKVADARYYGAYGAFDIVFCYRPLMKNDATERLLTFLDQEMKKDAVLILPWGNMAPHGWVTAVEENVHVWVRS